MKGEKSANNGKTEIHKRTRSQNQERKVQVWEKWLQSKKVCFGVILWYENSNRFLDINRMIKTSNNSWEKQ